MKWYLPVEWVYSGLVAVEGETLGEAIKNFNKSKDTIQKPEEYEETELKVILPSGGAITDVDYEYIKLFNS